jgi:SAM-dependent methyltransferase
MLFEWNTETIEYYERAAAYTGYFKKVAELIAPRLRPDDIVLDAGCGPGVLSREIAPLVASVIAVDENETALGHLREVIERDGTGNITPVLGDVADHLPDKSYDVALMHYFGGSGKLTQRVLQAVRRTCIIITYGGGDAYDPSRCLLGSAARHKPDAGYTRTALTEAGIPFTEENASLEFGQPFMSEDDAARYFDLYLKEDDPVARRSAIEKRVAELVPADPPYRLYRPKRRDIAIFASTR